MSLTLCKLEKGPRKHLNLWLERYLETFMQTISTVIMVLFENEFFSSFPNVKTSKEFRQQKALLIGPWGRKWCIFNDFPPRSITHKDVGFDEIILCNRESF